MARKQKKTIFISYRRTVSQMYALAIYQFFRLKGHNAFYDINGMTPGDFRSVLLHQIETRDHFLILLAPGTLDRCHEPGDWLRREIEYAMDTKRNIVPIFIEGFDFSKEQKNLTGKLADLPNYAGQKMDAELFEEIMMKIDKQFLKIPAKASVAQPISSIEQAAVEAAVASADSQPPVTQEQLTAEEYVALSYEYGIAGEYEAAFEAANQAIALDPNNAVAYNNRGLVLSHRGQDDLALADFDFAINLDPSFSASFNNRGNLYRHFGDSEAALADYTQSILLEPHSSPAYFNRGVIYSTLGEYELAVADFNKELDIRVTSMAYRHRAQAYRRLGKQIESDKDNQAAEEVLKYEWDELS